MLTKRKNLVRKRKDRFTRAGNNLEKAINGSVILKTLESTYNEFKDAWTDVQRKHDEYIEHVTEQSDEKEERIDKTFCKIEEKDDAFIEKKIKESESERHIKDKGNYTEELKLHREQEGIKLMQHIDEIEKLILQTAENKCDICEALKKGNKQLADRIAVCERIYLKYVILIKDQYDIEEKKQWILPFVNYAVKSALQFKFSLVVT